MTLLTLKDDNRLSSEDERTLLLGVEYDAQDAPDDRHLEADGELAVERERYDDQILAGLVCPW